MTKEDDDKPLSDEVSIEFDEEDEPEGKKEHFFFQIKIKHFCEGQYYIDAL